MKKIILLLTLTFTVVLAKSNPSGNSLWISPCQNAIFQTQEFVSTGGDELTVTAWVKWSSKDIDGVGNNAVIATLTSSESDPNIGVFWLQHNFDNTKFEFAVQTTKGKEYTRSLTTPEIGQWYHLTGIYNGEVLMLFVNGVLENITSLDGYINPIMNNPVFSLGGWASESENQRRFFGAIDEVSIWTRKLVNWEVYEMMNYPFNMTQNNEGEFAADGLHSYWNFDHLYNDSIYNLTGYSQNPEIIGEGAIISYSELKFDKTFHVVNQGNEAFQGQINLNGQTVNLQNGLVNYQLKVGEYSFNLLNQNDETVYYGEFLIKCSSDTIFIDLSQQPKVYYSQDNTDINNISGWNSRRDGGGVSPDDFNNSNHSFIIQNAHQLSSSGNISINGSLLLEDSAVFSTGGNYNIAISSLSMKNNTKFIIEEETQSISNVHFDDISSLSKIVFKSDYVYIPGGNFGSIEIDMTLHNKEIKLLDNISINDLIITNGIINIDKYILSVSGNIDYPGEGRDGMLKGEQYSELVIKGSSNKATIKEANLNKLVVKREAGVLIDGMVNVNSLELVNGKVYTSEDKYIIVHDSENLTYSSFSYVLGPLAQYVLPNISDNMQNTYFPVGTSKTIKPIAISVKHKDDKSGLYKVELIEEAAPVYDLPDEIEYVNNEYHIKLEVINDTKIDSGKITIFYTEDDNVLDSEKLRVVYIDDKNLYNLGGHGTGETHGSIISVHPFTQGGIFVLGNSLGESQALPVEWLNFEATFQGDHVAIQWTTASEINNHGFFIQKSYNANTFEPIAFVSGNGTTSQISNYEYLDFEIDDSADLVYYRLMQEDLDGSTDYSEIIAVNIKQTNNELEGYWFLNSNNDIILRLTSKIDIDASLRIFNVSGSSVIADEIFLNAGYNDILISQNDHSKGILIIDIQTKNDRLNYKIPVVR